LAARWIILLAVYALGLNEFFLCIEAMGFFFFRLVILTTMFSPLRRMIALTITLITYGMMGG